MQHILIKSLVLLLFFSCGDKENETVENEGITFEELENIEKENEPTISKLKELIPITAKEVDAWIPNTLNAMQRTSYVPDASPDTFIFVTNATFGDPNTNKSLNISFMDGAGAWGSMTIGPFFGLEKLYEEKSSDDGYQKTIKKNGRSVFQKYEKQGNQFLIEFVSQNRYLILINSEFLTEEELWHAIDQFHFEKLPGI